MISDEVTIHAARRHDDGPFYVQLDDVWYRISWTGSREPAADKTRPVRITTPEVESLRRELAKCRENFAEYVNDEFPLEAVRVGLDGEQEIRRAAAELWIAADYTSWKLEDWVRWIRDGGVPDA